MTTNTRKAGATAISAAVAVLGEHRQSIAEGPHNDGDPAVSRALADGFEFCHIEPDGQAIRHAEKAIRSLFENGEVASTDVDTVILGSDTMLRLGRHALRKEIAGLLARNGLSHTYLFPLFLGECGNFGAAVALARGLVESGQSRRVLVVASETRGERVYSWNSGALLSDSAIAAIVEPSQAEGLTIESIRTVNDVDLAASRVEPDGDLSLALKSLRFARRVGDLWGEDVRRVVADGAQVVFANLRDSFHHLFVRELRLPAECRADAEMRRAVGHSGASDILINVMNGVQTGRLSQGTRIVALMPGNHVWNILVASLGDMRRFRVDLPRI